MWNGKTFRIWLELQQLAGSEIPSDPELGKVCRLSFLRESKSSRIPRAVQGVHRLVCTFYKEDGYLPVQGYSLCQISDDGHPGQAEG